VLDKLRLEVARLQTSYEVAAKHLRGLPTSKRKVCKKNQEFDGKMKKYSGLTRLLSQLHHSVSDHHKYLQENL